jgi:hypothetical protein
MVLSMVMSGFALQEAKVDLNTLDLALSTPLHAAVQ